MERVEYCRSAQQMSLRASAEPSRQPWSEGCRRDYRAYRLSVVPTLRVHVPACHESTLLREVLLTASRDRAARGPQGIPRREADVRDLWEGVQARQGQSRPLFCRLSSAAQKPQSSHRTAPRLGDDDPPVRALRGVVHAQTGEEPDRLLHEVHRTNLGRCRQGPKKASRLAHLRALSPGSAHRPRLRALWDVVHTLQQPVQEVFEPVRAARLSGGLRSEEGASKTRRDFTCSSAVPHVRTVIQALLSGGPVVFEAVPIPWARCEPVAALEDQASENLRPRRRHMSVVRLPDRFIHTISESNGIYRRPHNPRDSGRHGRRREPSGCAYGVQLDQGRFHRPPARRGCLRIVTGRRRLLWTT
jgi:hypothetical protein